MIATLCAMVSIGLFAPGSSSGAHRYVVVRVRKTQSNSLEFSNEGRTVARFEGLGLGTTDAVQILGPEPSGDFFAYDPTQPAFVLVGGIRRGAYFFAAATSRDGGRHWTGGTRVDLDADLSYCSSGFLDGGALAATFSRPGELVDFLSDDGGATWSPPMIRHIGRGEREAAPCDEVVRRNPNLQDMP